MPPKPPASPARPLAPHVARAIQAQPDPGRQTGRPVAPHVARAIQARPATSPPSGGRPLAPHVARAIQTRSTPGSPVAQPASKKKKTKWIAPEPFPGLPPSQVPDLKQEEEDTKKYASKSKYVERRSLHQQQDRHVNIEPETLEKLLLGVEGKPANYMMGVAHIDGVPQPFAVSTTWKSDLETPFPHDHKGEEYDVSKGDVEVGFLSGALDLFAGDLKKNMFSSTWDSEPAVHELVLADNFGACDGCKDRIKRFKQLWHELAQEFQSRAQLKVTYVYHETFEQSRSGSKSLYGWHEATFKTLELSSPRKVGKKGRTETRLSYQQWSAKPKSYP